MKKVLMTIAAILLMKVNAFAETLVLNTGESIKGKILEQNKHYIKLLIDVNVQQMPYTFYLDEIASIDNKPINVNLSSPIVQQEKLKPFVDKDYGFRVTFPEKWYVVVGQNRIKQRIKDIERWQNIKVSQSSVYDPGSVQFAKKISNVIAEKISLAMTPFYAAYEDEPKNFYKGRRPIPEIKMEIREIKKDDPLKEAKRTIEMMLPFLDGKFINSPEFMDINGAKVMRYTIQYKEDGDIGEVIKSVYKIVHKQKEFSFELLSRKEGFKDNDFQFKNVIDSIEWLQK